MIARGFVTSQIIVPKQNLKDGVLKLKVVPGYIEDIRFEPQSTFGNWRSAFPDSPGDVLNIRDLEQGLEQLRQLPNQQADIKLKPGSKPGQSIVIVTISRSKPWTVGFTLNDAGMENTGRLQASTNLAIYNPTGQNDILSYNYTRDVEHQDENAGTRDSAFTYTIPYGYYTFHVYRYYDEFHRQIPALVPFELSGKTTTWDIGLQKVIDRDQTRKTQLSFKIIRRKKKSYVDGEELQIQRLNTTAYQIGLMQRQYVGNGIINSMIYFQKGMPWFGAEKGVDDYTTDVETTRYNLWGLNFYYGKPIHLGKLPANYSLTIRGQYTRQVLYEADQFSIGGRYTVHGFDGENTLSAENGCIIQNELSIPLGKSHQECYIGIDYGHVWGPSDQYLLGRNLAGAVIGIRGTLMHNMKYDTFIGAPLYKPAGLKTGKTTLGFNLYWQL